MTITVRTVDKYKHVKISHDQTKIDLGLFDKEERMELIITLREAVEALES